MEIQKVFQLEMAGRDRTGVSLLPRMPCDAYVIIIGAMNCGTSSLYTYLAEHPEICPCITKEPEFFQNIRSTATTGPTSTFRLIILCTIRRCPGPKPSWRGIHEKPRGLCQNRLDT